MGQETGYLIFRPDDELVKLGSVPNFLVPKFLDWEIRDGPQFHQFHLRSPRTGLKALFA